MAKSTTPGRKAGGKPKSKPPQPVLTRSGRVASRPTAAAMAAKHAAARKAAQAVILERLASAPMFKLAAMAARVHEKTLHLWRREDPEFDAACQSARWKAIAPMLEQLASSDAAASAAAARWLEKLAPMEFGRSGEFVDDDVGAGARVGRVKIEVVRSTGKG